MRWSSCAQALLMIAASACLARGDTLDDLATAYRKTPTTRTQNALLAFAHAHKKDQQGGLALLALGAGEVDQKQYTDAVTHLSEAERRVPEIADYAACFREEAEWQLRHAPEAEAAARSVWDRKPASPLRARATLLAARAYLQAGQADRALQVVNDHGAELNTQQAELARAQAYDALGRAAEAVEHYDRVWFDFPLSWEATQSEAALERLRGKGAGGPLPAKMVLERAAKLAAAGQYKRAEREIQAYVPQMSGAEQQVGQVRIGAMQYEQRRFREACDYLRSLQLNNPDADAERLYYVSLAAAHIDRWDFLQDALSRLERWYAKSPWRVQALVSAANRYVYSNQTGSAAPLYKACYEEFPDAAQAPGCQWKYAWQQYMQNRAGAKPLFEEQVRRWPDSEKAAAALYFLGRIAEGAHENGAARVYYQKIETDFPNQYYETLARTRLRDPAITAAAPAGDAQEFVRSLKLREQVTPKKLVAEGPTKVRLERARLLDAAGLDDLAQNELRFAASADSQPEVIAVAMADLASKDQSPAQAIRFIKHYVPGYLFLPMEPDTQRLWKLAFPLPWWDALQRSAREQGLDPYLFAALVRQESEFDPHVVSPANAYGLSQLLPPTARMLSRKARVGNFSPNLLFQPEINLKIGTFYLRSLLDSVGGRWDAALASYNAGRSRAVDWLHRANYEEPAEFVESIPITETRNYVQSIFRNADIYRRLYGEQATPHPSD